jgi:hypothetical protein
MQKKGSMDNIKIIYKEKKKSRYANRIIPNYVLESDYKLYSLVTLIKPQSCKEAIMENVVYGKFVYTIHEGRMRS